MRTAFIRSLVELAKQDERIWLVCGDLGYSVLEEFATAFPKRFLNAGVAEQNMTGIAAGLALSGKIPFTYSIANFPVMRCFEQVRNDVCHHNLPVKIVAVGGGLSYGTAGYTHYAVEDLAVMRALPHMTVVAPGDPIETKLATRAIAEHPGPCYLRLGKAGEPVVHQSDPPFRLGESILVREGRHAAILCTGGALRMSVDAANALSRDGYDVRVLSFPTVKPIDGVAILRAARETHALFVVEEHHAIGGLSDAVARVLVEGEAAGSRVCFLTLDIEAMRGGGFVASQATLAGRFGLSADGICRAVIEELKVTPVSKKLGLAR
ncbi:MAG TPA: transketolase C-terminal domain-containing protein [Bryobacteraceae bacterium]|nr:transketolase C-terminal domain-containing protein [Bryobacteraceae bacterium]